MDELQKTVKNFRYETMLPHEFLRAVKECPVFLVPTGLLEWHGDHLPLGLDALKIHAIALKIAERLGGGIVLPANYIGRPGFSSYTGTLTYSEGLVQQLFYETFSQLKKVGAKVIVLLSGHYGPLQEETVERAGEIFARENPDVGVIACAEYADAKVGEVYPCDHAGLWETSMYLHLYPEDRDRVKRNLHAEVAPMKIYFAPPNDYYKESAEWTWANDVLSASAETGKKAVSAIVDVFVKKIKILLKEKAGKNI